MQPDTTSDTPGGEGTLPVAWRAGEFNPTHAIRLEREQRSMAVAGFRFLCVLFEQAFVDVALDIGAERSPRFLLQPAISAKVQSPSSTRMATR